MHWPRAACCMQPCLLTCCLHWTDLFLGGSFGLLGQQCCVLIPPQSRSPRRGASQWEVSSCREDSVLYIGLDAMYGWPQRMGALSGGQEWVLTLWLSWLCEGCEVHDSRDGSAVFIKSSVTRRGGVTSREPSQRASRSGRATSAVAGVGLLAALRG